MDEPTQTEASTWHLPTVSEIFKSLLLQQMLLEPPSPPPPATIFHYTSAAGFHNILSEKTLLLTHSAYLNDQGETSYPVLQALEIVRDMRAKDLDKAHAMFWQFAEVLCHSHSFAGNWYVGSFSINGNQLSQWRAYTPNGGYSIGFRAASLVSQFPGFVRPVIYDKETQADGLRRFFEGMLNSWKAGLIGSTDNQADQFNHVFFRAASEVVTQMLIFWKSPAFIEEAEWRLAFQAWAPKVSFRLNGDQLTPSLRQHLPTVGDVVPLVPLNEVFVSPLGDPFLAQQAAAMFTASLGYPIGLVKPADIALRARR